MNNKTKIESLQKELEQLLEAEKKEMQKMVLPILREHAVIHFKRFCCSAFEVEIDEENCDVGYLMSLMSGGIDNLQCPLIDHVDFRYDDGKFCLWFHTLSGSNLEIETKIIDLLRELKIKVSFEDAISSIKRDMYKYTKELNHLLSLKDRYEM